MSTYHYAPGAVHLDNHKEVTINTSSTNVADIISAFMQHDAPQKSKPQTEDIEPVDTSFFCKQQFTEDTIERNIRQAINLANSKADACRRIMAMELMGYIVLSNVTDERKAELINPFASPKYTFCGDDFTKARNRRTK